MKRKKTKIVGHRWLKKRSNSR